MYDYIKGIPAGKNNSQKNCTVTIENNGIGYLFDVSIRDFTEISDLDGKEIKLYTVLLYKEDKMSLCGFLHREDRDIFNILTSVSGVGSRVAFTLLDEFPSAELIGLVIQGDFKALTCAKGVGRKLVQKIILELKDKLMNFKTNEPVVIETSKHQDSQAVEDAKTVLVSLGYEREEIKNALSKAFSALTENASAEDILKECLKILSV